MNEIKCPKCGEVFQVDEVGYASILKQVRDDEFQKEIKERETLLQAEKDSAVKAAVAKAEAAKDKEIGDLQTQISVAKSEKETALEKLKAEKEKEIGDLQSKITVAESTNAAQLERLKAEKDREIERLNGTIKLKETEAKAAVANAVAEKEKELTARNGEIMQLQDKLKAKDDETALKLKDQKERFEIELAGKDETIEFYKDMKTRQSTKMLGENLEQHCLNSFNSIRMAGFQGAYFEKDNKVSESGSKGDFIFRDSVDGVEYISIMFEMKNEGDETKSKHKNEDFFKELDKDRTEKGCEYAVLVSMLESDSELYNQGIVDVSYRYPKMYVIRPQFFIPLITLLRNAALGSAQYRKELEVIKSQQPDLVNFEANLDEFKRKFTKNFTQASDRFEEAMDGIDNAIKQLQAIKESLRVSRKHLGEANSKVEDVSVKRLTKNAPSVRKMLEEAKEAEE